MKTFKHNGKIGDIIYSLPTIKAMGGGILYIPEDTYDGCIRMCTNLKRLLESQSYIHEVRKYPSWLAYGELAPGIHIDYDLDKHRLQPLRGMVHIVKRFMDAFEIIEPNWKQPWLEIQEPSTYVQTAPNIISVTTRYREGSRVSWKKVIDHIEGAFAFVGYEDEYKWFCAEIGKRIPFIDTIDMLHLSYVIKSSENVYCNQNAVLALAQSLGKTTYIERKPGKENCLLKTDNEYILI